VFGLLKLYIKIIFYLLINKIFKQKKKVPKYLAEKWNTAPDNAEVGRIRISQSK